MSNRARSSLLRIAAAAVAVCIGWALGAACPAHVAVSLTHASSDAFAFFAGMT
jgi:hypothetical protein